MSDLRILSSPSAAASAYARVQNPDGIEQDAAGAFSTGASGSSFGDTLASALQGVVDTGHAADKAAAEGISGHGSLTQVVTAVSRAQLSLQATTAIRDKVVQAYQDIMKMSI